MSPSEGAAPSELGEATGGRWTDKALGVGLTRLGSATAGEVSTALLSGMCTGSGSFSPQARVADGSDCLSSKVREELDLPKIRIMINDE